MSVQIIIADNDEVLQDVLSFLTYTRLKPYPQYDTSMETSPKCPRCSSDVQSAWKTCPWCSSPLSMEHRLHHKSHAPGLESADLNTSIESVASTVAAECPDLRPHSAPDGTVTVLFSDIEGSTAMTERLGDQRAHEILGVHNAITRQQVAAHGGFEVKSMGDGFMLAFSSARRGVQCAIAIQRALATYNDERPDEPILVRTGLHTGEAVREADDFFGKHVILAARIASQAQGKQILVSSLFKELTECTGDIRFGEGREVELRGLSGTHQVYEVMWG